MNYESHKKLFKELKNGIIDQNSQNVGFGSKTQKPLGIR